MKPFIYSIFILVLMFAFSPAYGQWEKYDIDTNAPGAALVRVADINSDDTLDAVATLQGSGDVVWYEAPNWTRNIIDPNLDGAYGLYVADMDADNDSDVVACGLNEGVFWYENIGGLGGFWTQWSIDENLSVAQYVFAADIDGDDDMDVVAAGYQADSVVWYENDQLNWTKHPIANLNGPVGLYVADIDGDDDMDVVAAGYVADVVVWYENDLPTWTPHIIDANLDGAWGVYAADINGNDTLDVVATGFNADEVKWYENNNPTWTPHTIDPNLNGAGEIHLADIDLDDDYDVAVAAYYGNRVVWYENDLPNPDWGDENLISPNLFHANGVYAAYMDGDNDLDVVAAGGNWVSWYENKIVGIEKEFSNGLPKTYSLSQNYPNPFNPTTTIEFSIPKTEFVTLKIYNLPGQEVATLVSEKLNPGNYTSAWDASGFASGIYYYKLEAGMFVHTKKLLYIK